MDSFCGLWLFVWEELFLCLFEKRYFLVFALLNPQCVLCLLRHYIIFFFLSLKGALFLVASPPPACSHEDVLSLRECFTIWHKTYLSCIYSIRTVFIAKNTLTNVRGLVCRSVDLTCNLAIWHHLIVSMEIDKLYAILWNIPDRESVGCCCVPGT